MHTPWLLSTQMLMLFSVLLHKSCELNEHVHNVTLLIIICLVISFFKLDTQAIVLELLHSMEKPTEDLTKTTVATLTGAAMPRMEVICVHCTKEQKTLTFTARHTQTGQDSSSPNTHNLLVIPMRVACQEAR